MINITYSAQDVELANQIKDDLAKTRYEPVHPVLIVLVSGDSNHDPTVQEEVKRAIQKGITIVPILTEHVAIPPELDAYKPLKFIGGYKRNPLLTRLSTVSMSRKDVQQANRRALIVIGGIALVMFFLAVIGIYSGMVAFPVEEYNQEATFQQQMVDGLIGKTLEYIKPKSTDDALNFASTLEAAPTRLYYYARGTATAIPKSQGD